MSVKSQIIADISEIIIRENCTHEELYTGFEYLFSDQNPSKDSNVPINFGESEILPPSVVVLQVAHILEAFKERFSGRVSAFVTQQVRYGLARQLYVCIESYKLVAMPFCDHQTAEDWLMETHL